MLVSIYNGYFFIYNKFVYAFFLLPQDLPWRNPATFLYFLKELFNFQMLLSLLIYITVQGGTFLLRHHKAYICMRQEPGTLFMQINQVHVQENMTISPSVINFIFIDASSSKLFQLYYSYIDIFVAACFICVY